MTAITRGCWSFLGLFLTPLSPTSAQTVSPSHPFLYPIIESEKAECEHIYGDGAWQCFTSWVE